MRAYVDAPETGGAVVPANAPPGLSSAAFAPALLRSRRSPAGEVPQALERPDTCPHPMTARRGGVRVVRHCAACGQPFGLTGIAG